MPGFSKNSLEILREKVDLVEVISPHVPLKNQGSKKVGLCPFHQEKTPSFVISQGDRHYHCFGCGAHGDAIQFMMSYLKMNFQEAVEALAEKFHVSLEEKSEREYQGPSKTLLKEVLNVASRFYQCYLLHSQEGRSALIYLYQRGIDLGFIRQFGIGLSPSNSSIFRTYMKKKGYAAPLLEKAGLLKFLQGNQQRDFFSGRVMIPILDASSSTIGFSSRRFHEKANGPKYINTPETPLFKKSQILFGMSYARKEIIKQKKALLVEGQFDALRLIYSGFSLAVASQGTAFTEDQAKSLLSMGIEELYIAFDPDTAGLKSTEKVGNLFQKEGIEVFVLDLKEGLDPDAILMEKGPEFWASLMKEAKDFLSFLFQKKKEETQWNSPAEKTKLVSSIVEMIQGWDHPLMVHESLKKLAKLADVPEWTLGLEEKGFDVKVERKASISDHHIDPDRVLEADLLRWLFLLGQSKPELLEAVQENLSEKDLKGKSAKRLFQVYLEKMETEKTIDFLSLSVDLDTEDQLFLSEMLQKKVDPSKASTCFYQTMQKILERRWMEKREEIKNQILSGKLEEDEVLKLAKEFDELKKTLPKIRTESSSHF